MHTLTNQSTHHNYNDYNNIIIHCLIDDSQLWCKLWIHIYTLLCLESFQKGWFSWSFVRYIPTGGRHFCGENSNYTDIKN